METTSTHAQSNTSGGRGSTSYSKKSYSNDDVSHRTESPESSPSSRKKRSSKHHHRDSHHRHHHSKKRHNSLKTVDIDNFFFQENTESKNLNFFNSERRLRDVEKHQNVDTTPASTATLATPESTEPIESPSNRGVTMDEYSVSDLLTSDDSTSIVAKSRRHGISYKGNKESDSGKPLMNGSYNRKPGSIENTPSQKSPKMRERRISRVKGVVLKDSKDNIVSTIEKYLKICQLNYEQVETQINSTFSSLSNSINFRRKVLIEEAKLIRDRKVNSLNDAREKFLESQQPASSISTCAVQSAKYNGGQNDIAFNQSDDNVTYSIHEPWGDGEQNEIEAVTSLPAIKANIIDENVETKFKLEEGNMTFHFNVEDSKFISTIGNIKESLSSAQCSYVKGLDGIIGISGDKIDFEIHTRDANGDVNVSPMDSLVVRVYDSNKNKVPVDVISVSPAMTSSSEQYGAITKHICDSLNDELGVYRYSFTPVKSGNHEILVKLNDMEISTSPFIVLVYVKSDLKFESVSERPTERHSSEPGVQCSRMSENSSGGELTNSEVEEDDDLFHHNPQKMRERDWIVQKGGKSSLLRSLANVPSSIYATAEVHGMCAWQLRVTSACMNIVLSVGVKTRCDVTDLNEQFTCEFNMANFVKTAANRNKVSPPNHTVRRKSSMFSRLSWTFTVLFNDGRVRVTCHELDEDQKVDINLLTRFTLHPFCSMIHHHKGSVSQVCPRPQLTFL